MKIKVAIVFGTRPEAIKCAPVIKALKERYDLFEVIVVNTGQHREITDQVIQFFKIKVDHDLHIMTQDQPIDDLTSRLIIPLSHIFCETRPNFVFVQGDTTSTFVSSLAAYYNKVPICHIEAGLRTYDKFSPFPEEMNRQLTSVIADIHFSPTEKATNNLLAMGIKRRKILQTGNTVIDALKQVAEKMDLQRNRHGKNSAHILVTAHRRESYGQPLRRICRGVMRIAASNESVFVSFPVHPNPNIKDTVQKELKNIRNVKLLPPLSYLDFVRLMATADIILTDSGGIQEEAPFFRVPVLVLRDKSEREEGIQAGCLKIVGTDEDKIFKETISLLEDKDQYKKMSDAQNPFGDGQASERIVSGLAWFCGRGEKPNEFEVNSY